jgi:hypothetical protein
MKSDAKSNYCQTVYPLNTTFVGRVQLVFLKYKEANTSSTS